MMKNADSLPAVGIEYLPDGLVRMPDGEILQMDDLFPTPTFQVKSYEETLQSFRDSMFAIMGIPEMFVFNPPPAPPPFPPGPVSSWPRSDDYGMFLNVKKCECGSEKARSAGHSTWCPKYER